MPIQYEAQQKNDRNLLPSYSNFENNSLAVYFPKKMRNNDNCRLHCTDKQCSLTLNEKH